MPLLPPSVGRSRRPQLPAATAIVVGLCCLIGGCSLLPAPADARVRHSAAPAWQPGATPFQRSLHDHYADWYDLAKVRYWVMYFLLGELARRDGPNSANDLRLREVDTLNVGRDSIRVGEIFHDGLAEFDFVPDSTGRSAFIDYDVTERARQILQLQCFKPETAYALDALGRLIALHGICRVDTWDETSVIVAFSNGWMYWIGEDKAYDHKILRAGRDRNDLTRLSGKARSDTDAIPPDELAYDEDRYVYSDAGMLAESATAAMEQQRHASIYVGYLPIDVADVNVHPLPTCRGDGRWNGRSATPEEGGWDYTRLFVDLFINRRALTDKKTTEPDSVDLSITYDVYQRRERGMVKILSESLPYRQRLSGIDENDGIVLRLVSTPFFTAADSCQGEYEFDLTILGVGGMAVRKVPFSISSERFELIVADKASNGRAGIPACPRIPSTHPPDSLTILVPVTGLPYSDSAHAYVGRLDLYLIDNHNRNGGLVRLGELYASKFGDTTGQSLPTPPPSAVTSGPPPSLIATFPVTETLSAAYLTHRVWVPSVRTDGTRIRSGSYSLGAVVSAGGKVVAEAVLNNLRLE